MQEDGSVVGEDPGEWVGCQHGEVDDSTCACIAELGLPVFTRSRRPTQLLETAGPGPGLGSKGLNIITVTLGGDGSLISEDV